MLTPVLLLAAGIALLWGSAEGLVRGAAALGTRAGISSILIGLTVVSIGTSAPELVVSVAAALDDRPALALGNVFGSNLANVGLILALAALFRPLAMAPAAVRRDLPWMLAVTLLVYPLFLNHRMGRVEGSILAAVLFLYLFVLVRTARSDDAGRARREAGNAAAYTVPLLLIVGGSLGLVLAGRWIVGGAGALATELGISEMIVGLSVVAVGTSLPELATTVIAAMRREGDLAVGNILGSNIFNLTFVLGGTALVRPIDLDPSLLTVEYPAVLLISVALLPLALTRGRVTRVEGAILLALYGGAWVWILLRG